MRRLAVYLLVAVVAVLCRFSPGADYNLKVVTDAAPDYSDMASLIHSATSQWPTTKEKCWAMYYWNHIARRQTTPMCLHGDKFELTDPIRQFNDYGFAMCSTVAGINTAIWANMGLKVRFWDITLHTVPEVEYDGRWHMYDDSLSALYTLCDGVTIAGVEDIGKTLGCAASGGKEEPGHIGRYHCLYGTSANGFLSGADTPRSLHDEGCKVFNPKGLKLRTYYNNWDWGHRYVLNLRENEVYTRYYRKLDGQTPVSGLIVKSAAAPADYANQPAAAKAKGKKAFPGDPACFVPNNGGKKAGNDPEAANPRYRIRGNGLWTFRPVLTAAEYRKYVHSAKGIAPAEPAGLQPEQAGAPAEVVFRVQSANVATSQRIDAILFRKSAEDVAKMSVSVNNGLTWREIWRGDSTGEIKAEVPLVAEINGAYEPMLKIELLGRNSASDAALRSLEIDTVTQLDSKTQPKLRLGRNTIYVGAGDQTDSIVLWPDLREGQYQNDIVEQSNIASRPDHGSYFGPLHPATNDEDGYVVYRIDAPGDITRLTYGGRFYNRTCDGVKGYVRLFHSIDGKNWTQSWSLDHHEQPWDVIHYETIEVPRNTRSVWMKYLLRSPNIGDTGFGVSVYALRMEANYVPPDATFKPVEVAFKWKEAQQNYSTVERGHTQLVDRVPFTYAINVGGADHPVMESLQVNLQGAAPGAKYGYSDGKDVGGERILDRWVTVGRNLAEGKPYTVTVPSGTQWGAGDPDGRKLTDGVVGANYAGGATVAYTALYSKGQTPDITVDLGQAETCGAFRIHVGAGYPWWDALKGEVKDEVEVLTSIDGAAFVSRGVFDFNLRHKDIPINYMLTDDETAQAFNFELILAKPVEARYVRYHLTPARAMTVSEVQAFEAVAYEPFDLRIALPDGGQARR